MNTPITIQYTEAPRHLLSLKLMTLHLEAQLACLGIPYIFEGCWRDSIPIEYCVRVSIDERLYEFRVPCSMGMADFEETLIQDLIEKGLI